jgi:hypothetical protein
MAIAAFNSTSLTGNRKPFLCRLHIVAVLLVLDGASGVVVVTGGCWHHGMPSSQQVPMATGPFFLPINLCFCLCEGEACTEGAARVGEAAGAGPRQHCSAAGGGDVAVHARARPRPGARASLPRNSLAAYRLSPGM